MEGHLVYQYTIGNCPEGYNSSVSNSGSTNSLHTGPDNVVSDGFADSGGHRGFLRLPNR